MKSALDTLRADIPQDALLLVSSELNVRYLGGVDYTDGFLLISREEALLFADSRYIEVAKRDAHPDFKVILLSGRRTDMIRNHLNGKRLLIEENTVTASEHEAYKKAFENTDIAFSGAMVEGLRNIKSEAEKDFIIKAQEIAEKAYDEILGLIGTGMTEADIALELEYRMRKYGASGIAFDTIVASGSASSMPHAVPRRVPIEKGFITMDFGAKYNGYCSDMTRTVCLGQPTYEMRKVYETVGNAQNAALEFIAAGKKCADADKAARDIIADAGYGACFGHSLGHGVGLYIHESISLSPRSSGILEVGNIVTVEPGIYLEGRFGVRTEDMVYVTENGCENLTKARKDLIIL